LPEVATGYVVETDRQGCLVLLTTNISFLTPPHSTLNEKS
jgi:hypothetical protein